MRSLLDTLHENLRHPNSQIQIQEFSYDPEGECVRHWLPELARMPTKLIHHPWDAALTVLKVVGVELGMNYPNPIIDVHVARDRLTQVIFNNNNNNIPSYIYQQVIFITREKEAAAKATDANATNKVVFDNFDNVGDLSNPKVVKGKAPCPSSSSYDQRVPSMQNRCNKASRRKNEAQR